MGWGSNCKQVMLLNGAAAPPVVNLTMVFVLGLALVVLDRVALVLVLPASLLRYIKSLLVGLL